MTRTLRDLPHTPLLLVVLAACSSNSQPSSDGAVAIDSSIEADAGTIPADAPTTSSDARTDSSTIRVIANIASPRAISPTFYGQTYYNWVEAWGAQVSKVKDLVVPLGLNLLRVGGTPEDVSDPEMFDSNQIDKFVAYAADVGAKPLLQIPFVGMRDAANNLMPATSQNAAAMVQYANVTRGYGIRYFSIGNEPDIYADQKQTIDGQSAVGYTAEQFCARFTEFAAAMKAVDPTIHIIGPELSWKYWPSTDWLSPFLAGCGDLIDVVTYHFYPFSSEQDTAAAVLGSGRRFRSVIRNVRSLMADAGYSNKPLGITESHVTWDSDPAKPQLSGAPGTIAAGLWIADVLGVGMEEDLWTLVFWSLSEAWTIGFIDGRTPKPEYYALMTVSQHFRSAIATVTGAPAEVSVYAGRNAGSTPLLFVNKTNKEQDLTVAVVGGPTAPPDVSISIPPLSLVVMEIPDSGSASGWVYGNAQLSQGIGPQPFTPGTPPAAPGVDAAAPGVDAAALDTTTVTGADSAYNVDMPTG